MDLSRLIPIAKAQPYPLVFVTISGSAGVKGNWGKSSMWVLNAAANTSREYALAEAR